LHFGSLIAAVASYLQAKSAGGQWLIRIDDIDPPREVSGSAKRILGDLEAFGMRSDLPVLYQSRRFEAYELATHDLLRRGLAFHCGCTRSELPAGGVYPGTCRNGLPEGKTARSVRIRVSDGPIRFNDGIQGDIEEILAESTGDFVIRRADGLPAYQLAVVVDDAFQGVTEVVRGADLLSSTSRQIHLQHCQGLPTPIYSHHPVALAEDGHKLSKRLGSDPVSSRPKAEVLGMALEFLGQDCPRGLGLKELWSWALENWMLSNIPTSSRYNARSPL